FLRGIDLVQVPTTLLAMVDSSVGGKVAINLPQGKNLVGAFYQPRVVIADTATLRTLSEREFRAGVAEVIKYGIISDAALFDELERELPRLMARDAALLARVIARCCAIKAGVVSQDERESGLRAILNFGHTVGHAIEAVTEDGRSLHGEAVAIGMLAAARLSQRHAGLGEADVGRIESLLRRAGFDLTPPDVPFGQLLDAMRSDKKAREGKLRFVLARRIGETVVSDAVHESEIQEALHVRRR
ncbi:MAG: 3-dehydroquinate synthase, partial [Verrucomicrobiae bacterium]|nr:3-dehydroquinate synthase [Verrucomicrobiae bacterium]